MTRAEVAKHNTGNSSWVCIGNKVYDLTAFLDEHPGGSEVLLNQAGLDATEAYEDIGHSTDARLMKENYLVGEIVEEEKMLYSYDKEKWFEKIDDNKSDTYTMNLMVFYTALAILSAIIYYLLLR
ncbi:Cytochrome [Dirofilaria immitis]